MALHTEKSETDQNIFHAMMVPQNLHSYILYKSHNSIGHNISTKLYNFIKRFYYCKILYQVCNDYVISCTECQQATLKKPKYVKLHSPILQFSLSFISIDLLGPYSEMENGNQYMLTVICMLTMFSWCLYEQRPLKMSLMHT